jgi:hypothetical protein
VKRFLATFLLPAALLVISVVPALAITYGEPDGDGHPNVGAMIVDFGDGRGPRQICSGTLISPTVFLTASHCTVFVEALGITDVWVTFDSVFDPDTSTLIPGTIHSNPGYNQAQNDPGDIAVIVLDDAPPGLIPATLPTAGLFDELGAQNGLKGQTFTAVGYGVVEPQIGGGPPVFGGSGTRHVSESTFAALNKAWLRLSQNNATGDSGTCFGDSGGPNFFGDTDMIASITITGDAMCLATNTTLRLDTPSARAFLDDFVALP